MEFEFKMEIDRNVHKRVSLCLADFDPALFDRGQGSIPRMGDQACFSYPSRDLDKSDLSNLLLFVTPGVETRADLPDALPTSDWIHAAVQVRADGETSLVINRERVATSKVLLPTTPLHQWNLIVDGDAVGTRLFIRSLNIWPEVRY